MIESIYNFIDAMLDVMEEIIQIIMTILKLSLWVILFIACLPVFYLQIRREKKENRFISIKESKKKNHE